MRTKLKSREGFTLVELLVGMLAVGMLSLVVGAMLFFGWKSWRVNNASVEMQRDTSLAMRVIAREIRRTPINQITVGTSLTCVNTNGTYVFSQSGGDLNLQVDSQAAWPLIRNYVDSVNGFSTTKTNALGIVSVSLNLTAGDDISNNRMVIYSRN